MNPTRPAPDAVPAGDASRPDDGATPDATDTGGDAGKLTDDAKAVLDAARAVAGAYTGRFHSLRRLFAAEVSLARDAMVQALIYLLVATVMLGTGYLLLTALLVSGLRSAGAPWPLAIFIPLAISGAVAWFGIVRARAALQLADFEATRRELKLGLSGVARPAESAPTEPPP